MLRKDKDKLIQNAFLITASTSILVIFLIMLFLFLEGVPVFKVVSVYDFIFGEGWYPTHDFEPEFGIFPLLVGSISVTLVSGAIAIPLGIMTAIYLAEIATPKMAEIIKPLVEMLNALPSVVIGFFRHGHSSAFSAKRF